MPLFSILLLVRSRSIVFVCPEPCNGAAKTNGDKDRNYFLIPAHFA